MSSTPQSREALLRELVRVPSITGSPAEDLGARCIFEKLAALPYFQVHPEGLTLLPTPLEGDARPLHAVAALVMAQPATRATVILTGHFDVVDTAVYADLAPDALNPQSLAAALGADFPPSEDWIFGRGSMDMKAGLAVEMELLRDLAATPSRLPVNLLFVAVPDEENASAGMRGVVPWLLTLARDRGLDYLAAIDAEPSAAGLPDAPGPVLFEGTVGKVMPAFFCIGRETHVGDAYAGLSAAALSSRIHLLAEGNPALADPVNGLCTPSWICLEHKILRAGYSVTLPGTSVIYFNAYATTQTPDAILKAMHGLARDAAEDALRDQEISAEALAARGCLAATRRLAAPRPCPVQPGERLGLHVAVRTVQDLRCAAEDAVGAEAVAQRLDALARELPSGDLRDLSLSLLRELVLLANEQGPAVILAFLPPYYPPRSADPAQPRHAALLEAGTALLAEARNQHGLEITRCPLFTGLCDLSYFGFQGRPAELETLAGNMPGWGTLYSLPEGLAELDVPVANFGPTGYDAHKRSERLERAYSFDLYPRLLERYITLIAEANKGQG